MAFTLPDLPYSFDSLEPHIDAKTMEIHHGKHHQAYVDKLNAAVEGTEFADKDVKELLKNINEVPEDKRQAVINHGGGHANHSLFWEIMSSDGGGEPSGELAEVINSKFGSFDEFKKHQRPNYRVFAFFEDNYPEVLTASDLIISRSGGNIFEIAALGKPSILIPLPESAQNHQQQNAYEYSKTGAAIVIEEPNLKGNLVKKTIDKILTNPKEQEKMRRAALAFAKPKAAQVIANDILSG